MKRKRRSLSNRIQLLFDEMLYFLRHPSSPVDAAPTRELQTVRLEERLLMSASPVAVVADVLTSESASSVVGVEFAAIENSAADHQDSVSEYDDGQLLNNVALELGAGASESPGSSQIANNDLSATVPTATGPELIVIDYRVQDADDLLANLLDSDRDIRLLRLTAGSSGVGQITDKLAQLGNVSAIHLLTHGNSGEILLGSTVLNADTLAQHAPDLVAWQHNLTANADILLYGCDVAATTEGRNFVESLYKLTGADVAASVDATGHQEFNGNWNLEYSTGLIESYGIFTHDVQQNWLGKLASINVTTFADIVDGDTSSVANLMASKGSDNSISLREAILAVNAGPGGDTINLAPGNYVLSIGGNGENAALTGDLDILKNVTIQGAGAGLTTITGNGSDRVIEARSGVIIINNVTITGGATTVNTGGAITVRGGAATRLTLNDSVVSNTSSVNEGGGVFVVGDFTTFNANRVVFTGNSAGTGAAIATDGVVTLTEVEIYGNTATSKGGGISAGNQTTIINSAIHSNTAALGGGIYAEESLTLTNVTVSGNTATTNGGGIYSTESTMLNAANVTLTNATIANNNGSTVAGIKQNGSSTVTLKNTILHNNGDNGDGTFVSLGGNIDVAGTAGVPGAATGDPNLGSLQNNGGLTPTHALLGGGPAIDNGVPGGAPALDQRGFARVGNHDIGAYEYNGFNPANDAPVNTVPGTQATPQDTSLKFSTSGGNLIAVSDVDAGANPVEVTLNVTNGTVTLDLPVAVGVPTGSEALVPTTIGQVQHQPEVARSSNGNYVVVWSGKVPGDDPGIGYQLFDANHIPIGVEGRVNSTKLDVQNQPSVAMDALGNFVVVWTSTAQDSGISRGVYGQRFDATGTAVGGEFLINTTVANNQDAPSIAMAANGDFVVVWVADTDQDGNKEGVFAQRFNAAGVKQGGEFLINNIVFESQFFPEVAMSASGTFVVTWQDKTNDGDGDGIYARRFNAAGTPLGSQFQVNTSWDKAQLKPDIGMSAAGDFVIVWSTKHIGASDESVYGQLYAADGTAVGTEFRVNTYAIGSQDTPSIAMDADGDFVVAWESANQDNPGDLLRGIYAQQFDRNGTKVGSEFLVNTTTIGSQQTPSVAAAGNGDFVIAWQGAGTGDTDGVFIRRYDLPPPPLTFSSGDGILDSFVRFQGSLASINAALDGMTFTPTPSFSGVATVNVNVNDLGNTGPGGPKSDNDNITINVVGDTAPTITSNGGAPTAAINVSENSTAVTTVTATDADLPAQTLTYSISGGVDQTKFVINSTTGVLTFVTAPDFEVPTDAGTDNVYEVTVQVSDGTLTDTQAIAVTVTNVGVQAYESFNYGAGPLEGANSGSGWATGWTTTQGSSAVVNATGLNGPTGTLQVDAGSAQMNTSLQFSQNRHLDTAIGADGTTVWVSFLLKVDTLFGGMSLTLSDGAGAANTVSIGTNSDDFLITRDLSTFGAAYINNVLVDGTTYFLAARLDFQAGNDIVTLYVNPTPGLVNPDSPGSLVTQLTTADLGTFTQIGLVGGFTGNNSSIDEIRIGESFRDVAPAIVNAPPVITSHGGGPTAAINVAENTTAVTTVTATDSDLPAQTLTYSISGGADQTKFNINATTGVLTFAAAPDFEAPTDSDSNNVYEVTVQVSDGFAADTQAISVTVTNVAVEVTGELWFTTIGSGSATGESWTDAEIVRFGDAGDTFDLSGGVTSGTFSRLPGFVAPADIRAMHFVESNVRIGLSPNHFDVQRGDLILTLDPGGAPATVTLNTGDGNPGNDIVAERQDIVVYRPNVVGDYSTGEYFMLLDSKVDDGTKILNVHGFSLVEIDTTVGGTTLTAGTFVLAHANPNHQDIATLTITGTGVNSAANLIQNFLTGAVLGNSGDQIQGIHLLQQDTAFNGIPLSAGTLLVQVNAAGMYAGVAHEAFDVIALTVTQTEQDTVPGTAATGVLLFDGSDIQLADAANEPVNGFTIVSSSFPTVNQMPVANAGGPYVINEGDSLNLNGSASSDPDSNPLTYAWDLDNDGNFGEAGEPTTVTPTVSWSTLQSFGINDNGTYTIGLRVNNGLGGIDTTSTTLTVNNVAPTITSSLTPSVAENTTAVQTVTASDPVDSVTYTITGGIDQTRFTLNSGTGALAFVAAPDFEAPSDADGNNVYEVEVTASDGDGGTDVKLIRVTVTDIGGPLVVDTTSDTLDGDTSSVEALLAFKGIDNAISLREAIIAANNTPGAQVINLANGVYMLTRSGINEDSGVTGDLDVSGNVTIQGTVSGTTIIDGGAIDRVFDLKSAANVTMLDLTVRGGDIGNKWGGGINLATGSTLNLNRVVVSGNSGDSGGGIYSYKATVTAVDTTISGNSGKWGGGFYNDGGTATLQRVTVSGNTATTEGAGIYNVTVGATMSLTNVTVSGNTTTGKGGGLYTKRDVTMTNSTIVNNTAGSGGGIYIANPGTATLKNTIVALNTGGNSNVAVTSQGNNLDSENSLGLTQPGDLINTNPLLNALQQNSGHTATHAVRIGSAAIDAGATSGAPSVDQQGIARDANPDIGAFEFVAAVSNPPVAANDVYAVNEDDVLTVATNGVLANDTDADSDPLTAHLVSGPANGILNLNFDGSLTYTPNANFNGVDSFTYRASDGFTYSGTASVSITVNPVNDPPVITSNGGGATASINVPENSTAVTTVTSTDVDGGAPVYSIIGGADQSRFAINSSTGVLAFITAPNFEAPADANGDNVYVVIVRVSDGNGGVVNQTLNVRIVNANEAPTFVGLSATYLPGNTAGAVVGNVTATDPDAGDTITFSVSDNRFEVTGGVLKLKSGSSVNSTTEPSVAISITATDAAGLSLVSNFNLQVNNPPVAVNDSYDVDGTRQLSVSSPTAGVLANDTDSDSDPMTAVLVSGPSHAATFGLNADGTFWYRANAGYSGVDSFQYRVNDGRNLSPLTTVSFHVNQPGTLTYTSLLAAVAEHQTLTAPLQVGRFNIVDDGFGVNTVTLTGADAALFSLDGSNNLFLNAGLTIDFAVQSQFRVTGLLDDTAIAGTPDASRAVTVAVLNINDAPVGTFLPDVNVLEDSLPGAVSTSYAFSDRDGDPLSFSLQIVTQTPGLIKTISINQTTGIVSYALNANAWGSANLRITAKDPSHDSGSLSFNLNVQAVNDAPVAHLYVNSTQIDQTLVVTSPGILSSISDADHDAITVTLVSGTANGTLIFLPNGTFTYTAAKGFTGRDSFRYVASDGILNSNIGTAWIDVLPALVAPAPVPSSNASDFGSASAAMSQSGDLVSTGTNSTESVTQNVDSGTNAIGSVGGSSTPTGQHSSKSQSNDSDTDRQTSAATTQYTDEDLAGFFLLGLDKPDQQLEAIGNVSADDDISHGDNDTSRRSYAGVGRVDFDAAFLHSDSGNASYAASFEREAQYRQLAERVDERADSIAEQLRRETEFKGRVVGSVGVVTTGFSVGYLFWAIRGGMLVSGLLAQMPAWTMLDPLLVIDEDQEDDDTESLDNIVEREQAKLAKAAALVEATKKSTGLT